MEPSSKIPTIQRNLDNLQSDVNLILNKQSLLEEVVTGMIVTRAGEPGRVSIEKKKLSVCEKTTIASLCLVALAAIALLVACVVAAFGYFPIFVSALNMVTLGACLSLPIIGCVSIALMILAMFALNTLLNSRNNPMFVIQEQQSTS
ncbi:inclusion membrane protein IncB [Chlamydia sp. 17-3921]|uniref:inclusion membrane protein IncB n=1 Tax=Chlamydia sp. 17-3921 TaxID=2675798 RepID=UPI00191B063F|nr:inclusion membrane protein IncB [Chlamydia sp. 17-3921]